jgi:methylenetetrahydrofolate reductase (NADPH)
VFQIVAEVEPPTRPDLRRVRHQIGVLSPVADTFLIPDNHLGRATVSSIAVAHEVQAMGGTSIACLNSRDRNLLGFRRDLLTAAAYGVERFLFMYGDKPVAGGRTSELTVRAMIDEVRGLSGDKAFAGSAPFSVGVTAALKPLPAWKRAADFTFVQVSYSVEAQLRWREANEPAGPVYAGVMVLASTRMAEILAARIPDIEFPPGLIEAVTRDRAAGVAYAVEQVERLRESGAYDGVHLIPVSRYREVGALLEARRP